MRRLLLEDDAILGRLNTGADDYLVKPFASPGKLVARA
jgi:DNA-binding response OmpR family regulator